MFWRCVTVSACVLVALVAPWANGQPSGSWSAPSCGNPQWVTTLALRADGVLLAGTGDGQIWQGASDGRCWSKIATLPNLPVYQKPSGIGTLYSPAGKPGTLLAGGAGSSVGAGPLMRSDDGGRTWAAVSSGLPGAY
jgi:photosystem II stability/assembly factor-like uncharacterized protein